VALIVARPLRRVVDRPGTASSLRRVPRGVVPSFVAPTFRQRRDKYTGTVITENNQASTLKLKSPDLTCMERRDGTDATGRDEPEANP
jgi:hypothetical protein